MDDGVIKDGLVPGLPSSLSLSLSLLAVSCRLLSFAGIASREEGRRDQP